MGRFVGIAVSAAIGLGLAACGDDTTTVVNNTTTVTTQATDSTTEDTTVNVNDGYCGPATPDGVGIYDLATAGVDCKEGRKLAQQWWDFGCITKSSNTCRVGGMVCVRRQQELEATVYCRAESSDQEIRFVFANDV